MEDLSFLEKSLTKNEGGIMMPGKKKWSASPNKTNSWKRDLSKSRF